MRDAGHGEFAFSVCKYCMSLELPEYVVAMPVKIEIPKQLLPEDGRFGSGPTRVRREALESLLSAASQYVGTSHRRPAVKDVVGRIRSGLRDLYSLPDGYEVVLGLGGATAFWDVAVFCLIEQRSEHLVFGEFSSKFAASVAKAPHLKQPLIVESDPGTHPRLVVDPSVDTYALTHNETTTGVLMPVVRPQAPGLVVVDATSAAGAVAVEPGEFDAYYFSLQKAFGSEGGLWVALMSPPAIERVETLFASDRYVPPFLDLKQAIDNSRKDQTVNTPALATLFLMAEQLDWMNHQGGLEWAGGRAAENAAMLYGWAESTSYAEPFVAKPAERSPVTATIDFAGVDALEVAAVLRANGIVDIEPYRKLGRNQLRIGLWPAIPLSDVEALIESIEFVVSAIGD
jgi:phosphoserine aminotransferase